MLRGGAVSSAERANLMRNYTATPPQPTPGPTHALNAYK